jgi:hypothetical protein
LAEPARKLTLVTKQPRPIAQMTEAERRTYLRSTLPPGALGMFTVLGGNRGLSIICPHCAARPERFIKNWNRWRWLAAHIATKHKAGGYAID